MEKLKLHSKDLTAENIRKLAELFPNCLTEVKDNDPRNLSSSFNLHPF
jgi:adenine-specific DNA-methyltransferase